MDLTQYKLLGDFHCLSMQLPAQVPLQSVFGRLGSTSLNASHGLRQGAESSM